MEPSLENIQSVQLEKNSIFSYATTEYAKTIILTQRETGFSLLIEIDASEGILRLQRFSLRYKRQLEEKSVALHDAAVIEIVLEGLQSLFAYARLHNIYEIFCLLPEEEAKRLTLFGGLLVNCSSLLTREGKRTSFSLYSYPEAQNIVIRKIELIKSQIIQGLKAEQSKDPYLKAYLQNHKKSEVLSPCQQVTHAPKHIPESVLASLFM
jgi:hypothetical protein